MDKLVQGLQQRLDGITDGFVSVLPELGLIIGLVLLVVLEFFTEISSKIYGLFVALIVLLTLVSYTYINPLNNNYLLDLDKESIFINIFICIFSFFSLIFIALSNNFTTSLNKKNEYFIFSLTLILGCLILTRATTFVVFILAFELISISSYLLVSFFKNQRPIAEASAKYIIYGAFSTGVMIYGASLMYGLTGSTALINAQGYLQSENLGFTLGLILFTLGLCFKVAAVPFHFWAPDVYQTTNPSTLSLLGIVPKLAGFYVLLKIIQFYIPTNLWFSYFIFVLCVSTMVVGNLLALFQTNFLRLLAFSSISNSASLIALSLVPDSSTNFIFYLLIYSLFTQLSFFTAYKISLSQPSFECPEWRPNSNLSFWTALGLIIAMIGLLGLPPLGGFIAKINLFLPLIESYAASNKFIYLIIIILLIFFTLLSLYYYLIPIKYLILNKKKYNFYFTNVVSVNDLIIIVYSLLGMGLGLGLSQPLLELITAYLPT